MKSQSVKRASGGVPLRAGAVASGGLLGLLVLTSCFSFAPSWSVDEYDAGVIEGSGWPDAGIGPVGQDGGLPLEGACEVLDQRRCAFLERCALLGDAGVSACVEALDRSWCGPTTWPGHVARGSLRYDALAARACADAFLTRACADFAALPEACTRFVLPNSGLRAACFDGFSECLDGVCRGAACPRTCQLRGQPSEVCGVDADCQAGLYCRPSSSAPGVGQCTAFAPAAAGCDPVTRCAAPLACVQGSCQLLPPAGQSCLYGACDESAQCVADAGQCVAKRPEGSPCVAGQCLTGLLCDSLRGVCVPAVLTAPGSSCSPQQLCPLGTTCLGAQVLAPGACLPPLGFSQTCGRDAECAADLACLPADGGRVCARRLEAGAPCSTDRWCQVDATCTGGVCRRLPGRGEACAGPCRVGSTCVSNQVDGGFVCGPLLGPGVPCSADAQCESRRCVLGACLTACTP